VPPMMPRFYRLALDCMCAMLCFGCGAKQPRSVSSIASINRTPIFDLVTGSLGCSNAIMAADRDLPGDKWMTSPFHVNESRGSRVAPIAKRILEEVRPKLKQMSVVELGHCLKVQDGTGYTGYIADPLYAEGNEMIIAEMRSRSAQERQMLLDLPFDGADIDTGVQGPPLSMDELVREVVPRPSENPQNTRR
jgi:hypothetical protein